MKRIKVLKKKKIIFAITSILMVLCAGVVFAAMMGDRPQEAAAITSGTDKKTETVNSGRGGTQKKDQEDGAKEQKIEEEKTKETTDRKSAGSAAQSKNESRSSERTPDANTSSNEKKDTSQTGKAEPEKPSHVHDYQPEEGTETVTYEVPVIGDRCSSCNEDITGFAEKHIRDTTCRGYATDVVVGYETVTEKVPCIYYICSCGAVKQ